MAIIYPRERTKLLEGQHNVIKEVHLSVTVRYGKVYKILSTPKGSVKAIYDLQGNLTQEFEYDEYGAILNAKNPFFQPLTFNSGLYDYDTKLVRFGARDYDPEVGRWTSKDPILFEGGDTNLYGYTFNDPVNFIDPSGLAVGDWWDLPANYNRSREIANEEYANWSGHHNDRGDAMRHYEWSRRTTAETNSFTAFTAGWAHEIEYFFRRGTMPASQYLRESMMDVHNNALGRQNGRNGNLICPSNLSTQPGSGGY
ncbi:RHS repeat-associated core domain-containing protein [Bdellovibrio sp. 22V]|uniref:RHS repeat-associated core domain-containing protein n=1 Tax=Bdellovibrio sp. 22V TaxID=3044166 RepID=UPI0025432140|nr:RHS repeat-associated core domain-containing protein [Bdellovibrio sp. 22V]WII72748.1 RHS repeat-associated core domain-containing protein [Bdellovibrio sp. 22V]